MKRVFILCLLIAFAGLCSAASTWTRLTTSGAGNWNDASNWDAGGVPTSTTDEVNTAVNAANLAEILVTDAQTFGIRIYHGRNTVATTNGPLIRIQSGGSLSWSTASTANSYIGYSSSAQMLIEAGGTFTTGRKLYVGTNSGVTGTVDVAGTFDVAAGTYGKLCLGNGTAGTGYVNVLDGGLLKLTNFHATYNGLIIEAGSILDISGTGKVVSAGDKLSYAEALIAGGRVSGNGVLGNVVASYDAGLDETSITAVPLADIPLEVTVEADKGYTRGLAPLTVGAAVVDDGNPAQAVLTWSQTAGPGTAAFESPNAATTFVDFDAGGVYTLRLTVDNTGGGGSEIVYDELEVTASNPTCQDLKDHNMRLAGDVNGDCYVNLADVAEIATAWLSCNNPQDTACGWAWE